MAKRLKEEGDYIHSFSQINEKIKTVEKSYKKVKDNNSLSGRKRKMLKFFETFDEIIGGRPKREIVFCKRNRVRPGFVPGSPRDKRTRVRPGLVIVV